MNKKRMRSSIISIIGQTMFALGLLMAWFTADADLGEALVIVAIIIATIGLGLALYGDFTIDAKKYNELAEAGNHNNLQPPAALLFLGATALSLGIIGVIFITMGDAWDSTLWVAIEVGSIILGAVLLVLGFAVNKQRIEVADKLLSEKANEANNQN
ncbi:MAG: hypothetical protein FWE36_03335 [Erysipelotrichales bacterium]|nr:hypothetical protein [Erysipelotrichales bacterium]